MNKVTVVTVSYNAENQIEATIKNVIAQTYANFEYIIIDGGSKDGTLAILDKYRDWLAYFISEPDKGIYDAMNKGIDAATGEWIIFMNAGDCFASDDVLEKVFDGKHYEEYGAVYGDTIEKIDGGNLFYISGEFTEKSFSIPFCHQSVFARTSLMKKHHFDISYKVAADFNFFNTLFREGEKFKHVSVFVSLYDTIGFSSDNSILSFKEVARSKGVNSGFIYNLRLLTKHLRQYVPAWVYRVSRKFRYKVVK